MYIGHTRLSVHGRVPTLLHGPEGNLGEWYAGAPYLCANGWICKRCMGCVPMAT